MVEGTKAIDLLQGSLPNKAVMILYTTIVQLS